MEKLWTFYSLCAMLYVVEIGLFPISRIINKAFHRQTYI